jgi:hypothetical protein
VGDRLWRSKGAHDALLVLACSAELSPESMGWKRRCLIIEGRPCNELPRRKAEAGRTAKNGARRSSASTDGRAAGRDAHRRHGTDSYTRRGSRCDQHRTGPLVGRVVPIAARSFPIPLRRARPRRFEQGRPPPFQAALRPGKDLRTMRWGADPNRGRKTARRERSRRRRGAQSLAAWEKEARAVAQPGCGGEGS